VVREASVIFLHVPKAAGTTFRGVLRGVYGRHRSFRVDGYDIPGSLERLAGMPVWRRKLLRSYEGHMAYGLHEHLGGPAAYVAFVRDPVARLVSHYDYVVRTPSSRLHPETIERGYDLKRYVEEASFARVVNDSQVRYLGGSLLGDDSPPEELLERAKRRIDEGRLCCGVVERFDDSLAAISRALRWKRVPAYNSLNVAEKRAEPPDPETRRAILERNAHDAELHRFALQRLDELGG
jgi:hypothetical protein